MAEKNDKKTTKYTGKVKHIDQKGMGYIVPDMDIIANPSSLSSVPIREGDRVEFSIKFNNDSDPQIEAIDVVPIKVQCTNCRQYGHSSQNCRRKYSTSRVKLVKCYHCGLLGHFARDCYKIRRERYSSVEGVNSSSVVSVKRKEDVRKVEKVEDCFILEFNPNENGDDDRSNGITEAMKKEVKEEEDCEVMRSIVSVKNVEDMKKVEQVEDCFILDFDPDEPSKLSNLSLCDNNSDDVSVLAEKGKVACRDYPHSRHLCVTHPFKTTTHESHCKMCYCYVCEKPAPCEKWTKGDPCLRHCDATVDCPSSNRLKETKKWLDHFELQQ
ncbi:unnamed protein product [Amaranthus hypochondriacus]